MTALRRIAAVLTVLTAAMVVATWPPSCAVAAGWGVVSVALGVAAWRWAR